MQKNGAKPKFCAEKSQNVVSVACKPSSVIGGHLSRPIVTDGFKRNPESIDGPSQSLFRFLLRAGFTSRTSRQAAGELLPHLSTLTRQACGISLLHFPWGHPRRVLPGTLPYGARTFLGRMRARDRPASSQPKAQLITRVALRQVKSRENGGKMGQTIDKVSKEKRF